MFMRFLTARLCLLSAILSSSLLTLAMPLAVSMGGASGLILCRGGTGLMQGQAQGVLYTVLGLGGSVQVLI